MRGDLTGIHVVLQAGGRGERLRNGESLPKPLFNIDGVTIIERLLGQIAAAGAAAITVITGYGGDEVERSVLASARNLNIAPPAFLRETTPRGNAGSLASVRRDLPCLFCFADLVTDIDFGVMANVHRERAAAVTLASHYETMQVRLGALIADEDTVLEYREKPRYRVLIASGVALFERAVLDVVPDDRPVGLSDVVQRAIAGGYSVKHWLHGAPWIDVNTREDLDAARLMLAGRARVA